MTRRGLGFEPERRLTVSMGVCAYNEVDRIPAALESIDAQELPIGVVIGEVIVVASGCTDGTDRFVEGWIATHPRVRLVREPERRGKASALNLILDRYRGDLLVLLNGDARLGPGALSALLASFLNDPSTQIACGRPVPDDGTGSVRGPVERAYWGLHNRTLGALSERRLANHCCDELLAFRRGFLETFPAGLVNDGAYLGVLAAKQGSSVRFSPNAVVVVETPPSLRALVAQRRRILRGHRQIVELLGQAPSVFREVARRRPGLALRILLQECAADPPSAMALLLVGLPLELVSNLLSRLDGIGHPPYQPAWPVVDQL